MALSDGRLIGVSIAGFPRLLRASRNRREDCRLSNRDLHWEALGEDVSVAGLLAGFGDRNRRLPNAAE